VKTDRKGDGWISDLAGAICDPVIIHRCSWGTRDMIPDWLAGQIKIDRLLELAVANKENRAPIGTDSEALAYMIPRSMESPMGSDWNDIYLYLATHVIEHSPDKKMEVPADIRHETISDYQMNYLLRPLKHWIYEKKTEHRKEKARGERLQAKEQAEKEELETMPDQPSFF